MGAPGRVGADEHALARPGIGSGKLSENLFDQVNVPSGRIGFRIARTQGFGDGLPDRSPAVVDERQQGVESEPFL